jgi:hypothetical protein
MYQLKYRLSTSRFTKIKILGIDKEQQELYGAVVRWVNRK